MEKKYYLGLDLGTNSIGFAATNPQYEVLKFHQKSIWGIRLFDEASTAAKRRSFRASNRRNMRRVQRIKLLQDFFSEPIAAIDPAFFQRLKDSFFLPEDKTIGQKYSLFNDPHFTDVQFYQQYPTIYHLRYDLMTSTAPHDVRLVYLACAHFLNKRGHFLYSGEKFDLSKQYEILFNDFQQILDEFFELNFPIQNSRLLLDCFLDSTLKKAEKLQLATALFDSDSDPKLVKAILSLLLGYKVKFSALFGEEFKDLSPNDLTYSGSGFEDDKIAEIQRALPDEHFATLNVLNALFRYFQLQNVLRGSNSFSEAKVHVFEKHKSDLHRLKKLYRSLLTANEYKDFFSTSKSGENNYVAYSGHLARNGKRLPVNYRCDHSAFLELLTKKLKILTPVDPSAKAELEAVRSEIENKTFLPLITTKDNGTIPNQLQAAELQQILNNASTYLPFLSVKHEEDFTTAQMILQLLTFRIPYYIGPLNPAHAISEGKDDGSHHAWIAKRLPLPIRPWNFSQVVDEAESAERFINRMTNKCTYLIGEDVLPRESPSYSKYAILNLLNVTTVDGQRIPPQLKQQIFMEFFLKPGHKKATRHNILTFLRLNGYPGISDAQLGGMDLEIPGSMHAVYELENAAPDKLSLENKEKIVRLITILPDSGHLLKSRLVSELKGILTDEEIIRVSRLKFSGWGRLSDKLLNGITTHCKDGQQRTLLQMMWENNLNLNELLAPPYEFSKAIESANAALLGTKNNLGYALVRDYPCSPSVKKMVWQALKVTHEVIKVNGCPPQKIFIEVAREEGEKKRTTSRKGQLLQLYENCKTDTKKWSAEVSALSEDQLRDKKLFLYYTQLGRCMYTGESINLASLSQKDSLGHDIYDVDHIYPRSKTKDDSILNNLVLVKGKLNREKSDTYPLPEDVRSKQFAFWSQLRDQKLITEEKFRRLVRKEELTQEELAGFINRQLVETRQATKTVADILKQTFPEIRVIYVKAGQVSDFRNKQEGFRFPKTRGMNDLHHAKDAYLNIVVGNVFDCQFTQDPLNYFRKHTHTQYNLAKIYAFDVKDPESDQLAWQQGEKGSLATVSKMLSRNNILFTRQTYHQKSGQNGGLFDQNLMPKGQGQFPIKASDVRLAGGDGIAKYGGYNKETGFGFFVVEHMQKKKRVRTIQPLPLSWVMVHGRSKASLHKFCIEKLKLSEPNIVLTDLPYQSLLKVNNFPFRLIAKTGASLKLTPALQPLFPQDVEKTIHLVQKAKDLEKEEDFYGLPTSEEALRLYDVFYEKLCTKPYHLVSALRTQARNISEGRQYFILLNQKEQAKVLREILMLFQCNGTLSDLSLLLPKSADGKPAAGNSQCGMLTLNQNLQQGTPVQLINQSATGLFENIMELHEI
jgi:CRISPR-associated endonuclease Csn1